MKKLPPFTALLVAFVLLSGCQSKTDQAQEKPAKSANEYTSVTPTGSWISKRVKKTEVQTSEGESAQAQEAMRQIQRQGNRTVKDSGN